MLPTDNMNVYINFSKITLVFKNVIELADFETNCFTNASSIIWFFAFIGQHYIIYISNELNAVIGQ